MSLLVKSTRSLVKNVQNLQKLTTISSTSLFIISPQKLNFGSLNKGIFSKELVNQQVCLFKILLIFPKKRYNNNDSKGFRQKFEH